MLPTWYSTLPQIAPIGVPWILNSWEDVLWITEARSLVKRDITTTPMRIQTMQKRRVGMDFVAQSPYPTVLILTKTHQTPEEEKHYVFQFPVQCGPLMPDISTLEIRLQIIRMHRWYSFIKHGFFWVIYISESWHEYDDMQSISRVFRFSDLVGPSDDAHHPNS